MTQDSNDDRDRLYADAVRGSLKRFNPRDGLVEHDVARVVMAVADAEMAELRAEVERLRESQGKRCAEDAEAKECEHQWVRRWSPLREVCVFGCGAAAVYPDHPDFRTALAEPETTTTFGADLIG